MSDAALSAGGALQEAYGKFHSDDARTRCELAARSEATSVEALAYVQSFERALACCGVGGSVPQQLAPWPLVSRLVAVEIPEHQVALCRMRDIPRMVRSSHRRNDFGCWPFAHPMHQRPWLRGRRSMGSFLQEASTER